MNISLVYRLSVSDKSGPVTSQACFYGGLTAFLIAIDNFKSCVRMISSCAENINDIARKVYSDKMQKRTRTYTGRTAMTVMEMIMALAIIGFVFAALLPQFRLINNSWDSKQGNAEVLQNGRVLMDHISRNLSEAASIIAVSDPCETDGYIEFEDNDGNSLRYEIDAGNYVEFGPVGNLSDLAGPVSSLQFTCYDDNDFSTNITDGNYIRLVNVQTVLPNSAALGQDKTFTTSIYLRTGQGSSCDSNLVGWWKLDETSGTIATDSSGNSNDGTLVNMDPATDWISGQVGGALDFDGWNDYVNLGADSSLNFETSEPFTIAAWVKTTENYGIVVSFRSSTDDGADIDLSVGYEGANNDPGKAMFLVRQDGGGQYANVAGDLVSDGQWHHVAGVRDSSGTIELFVDGESQGTDSGAQSGGAITTDLRAIGSERRWVSVGYGTADQRYLEGTVDDVRIYNRALDANEIAQLINTITFEAFTEAKVDTDGTSITIPTPADSTVSILGSWTSGLTHTAEAGSNRLLVLTAHVEEGGSISLNSVTYGGQPMTKVIDEIAGTSYRAYVVTYILKETGIAAASGNTFVPNWSTTPDNVSYSSVFLSNVNQTTPIGATTSNGTSGSSPNPITTSSLSTANGDMVIVAATCGNTGDYTVDNGFTEAIELDMASSTGVAGYKTATGSNETPSVTHSGPNRQVIVGMVVQSGGMSDIEGDLLIAAVATDGDTSSSLAAPLGEGWTKINAANYNGQVTLGAWWKLADASESASHQFTWSGDEQAYGWIMRFTGHDPTDPINTWSAGGESSSTPTSPEVTTTVDNCLILRLGAFDDADITVDDPCLSGHTAITMDESGSSGITLFQDGFETGFGNWTTDWNRSSSMQHSGTWSAEADRYSNNLTSNVINTSGYSSITIDFWYWVQGIDDNDNVYLQLYDSSGNYDNYFEVGNQSEGQWLHYQQTITDSQYLHSNFRVNFSGSSIDNGEYLWIDDFVITVPADGTVSGGAGYILQGASGDSGTSNFTLTAANEAQMITIAIAPQVSDELGACSGSLRP
jgi:type II secretory pathway pseudopilin PulG